MELIDAFLTDKALEVLRRSEVGELEGLVELFQSKGLGGVIFAWIAGDENAPVPPDQIREVLGQELIQQFATHLGTTVREAPLLLARLLPLIVSKLADENGLMPAGPLLHAGSSLASIF